MGFPMHYSFEPVQCECECGCETEVRIVGTFPIHPDEADPVMCERCDEGCIDCDGCGQRMRLEDAGCVSGNAAFGDYVGHIGGCP